MSGEKDGKISLFRDERRFLLFRFPVSAQKNSLGIRPGERKKEFVYQVAFMARAMAF